MNISENTQESFMKNGMGGNKYNVLLLGGAGFLGRGLARELERRRFSFKIIDRPDMDLADASNISSLAELVREFNCVFLLAS